MAELKRQAAQGRPASAGPSSSARGAASSSQKHDSRGKADDDSPKSNMSSPWGTDVSLLTCAYSEVYLTNLRSHERKPAGLYSRELPEGSDIVYIKLICHISVGTLSLLELKHMWPGERV